MNTVRMVAALAITVGLMTTAMAEDAKISGYMFGDYYWVISADDFATKSAFGGSIPKDPVAEKQNGFQFRRVYFTYDKGIADDFSVRWRIEAGDAGYGSGDKMVPFVKHAYLKWKKGLIGADVYLGLSGTPTWSLSEKVWGYRAVEKTILDLNKIGSSADIGVGLKGKSGGTAYRVMIANGPGQKSEDDNGKKIYGSLTIEPSTGLKLQGYADFNMRPGDRNQMTVKGFLAISKESLRLGIEPFMRINKEAGVAKEAGGDVTITGASVFAVLDLTDGLTGFGRVDAVSNNDLDTTDLLLIAGIDKAPAKNVHLMPNIRIEMPDGPDPSIQLRITSYYKF